MDAFLVKCKLPKLTEVEEKNHKDNNINSSK